MSVLRLWVLSTLFLVSCRESLTQERGFLTKTLWKKIQLHERKAEIVIPLDASTFEQHQQNMLILESKIPPSFPEPYLPYGKLGDEFDPRLSYQPQLSLELINLGEKLFFEESLSFSSTSGFSGGTSCASCHQPEQGFAEHKRLSLGVDGAVTSRNTLGLLNVAYYASLTWVPLFLPVLEKQADIPLFGDDPIEMGLRGKEREVPTALIAKDETYPELFRQAFTDVPAFQLHESHFDYNAITAALAAYERSLIDFTNPVDQLLKGEEELLDPQILSGLKLFYGIETLASGETLTCGSCHSGFNFSDSFQYVRGSTYYRNSPFHQATLDDETKYRTPSLRNLRITAPYGHDGSFHDLKSLLDFYEAGKRPSVKAFRLTEEEKAKLLNFLIAL